MLVGLAMVIPYFSYSTQKIGKSAEEMRKIFTPIIGKPNVSKDKYWYVDRKFFDRSGWEELIEVKSFNNKNKNNKSSEEIKIDNINILDFIKANSIRINIPTTSSTITSSARPSPFDIEVDINDENDEEDLFHRGW